MRVAIVICTCNRPKGLTRVLQSLADMLVTDDYKVDLVVIDNSSNGNASSTVETLRYDMPWALHYIHEKKSGISYARNAGLEHVLAMGCDYMASLDDDMHVHKNWLQEIVLMALNSDAEAVINFKKFDYPVGENWWVDGAFRLDYRDTIDGQLMDQGHTGGCVIKLDYIRCSKLRFEEDLGRSGGEDTLFFDCILNSGGKILYAKKAISYEVLGLDRTRVKWWLKRWYRTGNTTGLVELAAGRRTRLQVVIAGVVRILVGFVGSLVGLPWLMMQRTTGMRAIRLIFRGMGYIAAAFGFRYEEYANGGRSE